MLTERQWMRSILLLLALLLTVFLLSISLLIPSYKIINLLTKEEDNTHYSLAEAVEEVLSHPELNDRYITEVIYQEYKGEIDSELDFPSTFINDIVDTKVSTYDNGSYTVEGFTSFEEETDLEINVNESQLIFGSDIDVPLDFMDIISSNMNSISFNITNSIVVINANTTFLNSCVSYTIENSIVYFTQEIPKQYVNSEEQSSILEDSSFINSLILINNPLDYVYRGQLIGNNTYIDVKETTA